jgi:uncharacterized protein (TIGR02147 family)
MGEGRSGIKAAVARALDCHSTYISQIINGKSFLSLEQADKLNSFFNHGKEEAEYFLLLVGKARAGTVSLGKYYQNQIDGILRQRTVLKRRLEIPEGILAEHESRFYSSWIYSAIHALASIPRFQTVSQLAAHLQLSPGRVSEILEFLCRIGLLEPHGDQYRPSRRSVYLGSDSANISRHHVNWRIRAIQAAEVPSELGTHFSGAVSLSQEDAQVIREIFIRTIKRSMDVATKSKDEVAYGVCLDFFPI